MRSIVHLHSKRSGSLRILAPFVLGSKGKLGAACVLLLCYSVLTVLPALITQLIIDDGFGAANLRAIVLLALLLVAVTSAQSGLSVGATKLLAHFGQGIVSDLRESLVSRALTMPQDWLSDKDDGYIASRINEVNNVSSLFSQTSFTFLSSILQAAAAISLIASVDLRILAFAALPIPIYAVYAICSIRKYRTAMAEAFEAGARLAGRTTEAVASREETRINASSSYGAKRVGGASKLFRDKTVRQTVLAAITGEGMKVLTTASAALVYIVCGLLMFDSRLSLGQIVASVQYASYLYSPFLVVVSVSISIQPAFAALRRIAEVFPSISSPHGARVEMKADPKKIDIRGLSFKWDDGDRTLFEGLNATLERPSLVLVKGRNGSGKTTLANILLGSMRGWTGSILVDGVPLESISPDSWRMRCSAVSQHPFLLNASVRENVTFGIEGVSEEDYKSAVHLAGLDEVIDRMPEGDRTEVGPSASKLSGGERQKVAIARAILRGASILLFDEPASGLDALSKSRLVELLVTLAEDKMVVVIDHDGLFDEVASSVICL